MYKLATVNEWWRLTEQYPEFRNNTWCVLKEYGYLEIFKYLDANPQIKRILEFGHGFSALLFSRYEHDRELWGVDDFQGLTYFPDREGWEKTYRDSFSQFSKVNFVRGLLGNVEEKSLPLGYFDMICSVSVLEEVPMTTVEQIMTHCHKLLRPGGVLVQTHDIVLNNSERLNDYLQLHRKLGFSLDESGRHTFEREEALIEPQTQVMLAYQMAEPAETRKYWGNFGTIFTVATRT